MTHVATLVSAQAMPAVTPGICRTVHDALPSPGQVRVLEGEIAAEIVFAAPPGESRAALQDRLRNAIGAAPVDVVVQVAAHRGKKLFLADMDSTMIGQECIDELADYVGLRSEVSAITERAMRGEIAFEPALRERVALLAGLPASLIEEILRERITLTPGGCDFVRMFTAAGGHAALVSGGFTLFTERIAGMIGFAENRANRLEVGPDGRLTGKVAEPILGREAKRETLRELRQRLGLAAHETLAIGDGANDLAMLGEAGLGVAFRAKPAVAAAAHTRLDHADLLALVHIVGLSAA